jgi:hypothetical protein
MLVVHLRSRCCVLIECVGVCVRPGCAGVGHGGRAAHPAACAASWPLGQGSAVPCGHPGAPCAAGPRRRYVVPRRAAQRRATQELHGGSGHTCPRGTRGIGSEAVRYHCCDTCCYPSHHLRRRLSLVVLCDVFTRSKPHSHTLDPLLLTRSLLPLTRTHARPLANPLPHSATHSHSHSCSHALAPRCHLKSPA